MRGQSGQILDWAEVGEEIELLAQGDIDALEAPSDRRGDWPLERYVGAFDGFRESGGNVLAVDFKGFSAGGEPLPFPLDPSGFENANDGLRDLGSDAVTGDECDFVGHDSAPGY